MGAITGNAFLTVGLGLVVAGSWLATAESFTVGFAVVVDPPESALPEPESLDTCASEGGATQFTPLPPPTALQFPLLLLVTGSTLQLVTAGTRQPSRIRRRTQRGRELNATDLNIAPISTA
jgi:hypothetical protein